MRTGRGVQNRMMTLPYRLSRRQAQGPAVVALTFLFLSAACVWLCMTAEAGLRSRTPTLRVFFGGSGFLFFAVTLWFAAYYLLLRYGRCVVTATADHKLLECRRELFGLTFGSPFRASSDRVYDLRVAQGEYGWHVAFDGNGRTYRLGRSLTEEEAREVYQSLKPFAPQEAEPERRFRLSERVCGGADGTVE